MMDTYLLSHLDVLEAEAIHIMREVAAEFERPVLLFSGGKDSICMLRLAEKAFRPARFPFPLLHIDTGHNFREVLEFRDHRVAELGERLIVRTVDDAIKSGLAAEPSGPDKSRNWLQIPTLLSAIEEFKFDAAFGGARRDEEKARAKERLFSFRDEFGQWDPRNQRPELWNLYNSRISPGQHIRVFPLSNWTEMDVWQYIDRENLEIPAIYFAHERDVFWRDGMWMSRSELLPLRRSERIERKSVRFRTVGDIVCTAAIESQAQTVPEIIQEISALRVTERGARADDRRSETAMEDRKREGYF
jgi:sulfate adenylyltransferase subunit 2